MTTRLAIDFGARFADFVAWDDSGIQTAKIPNGPDVAQVLNEGFATLGLDVATLDEIRVVSTEPLNALLERRLANVALLTTEGFADTLRLGRQNRLDLYDPVARSPAPVFLVRPEDTFEIGGRLDRQGNETVPLDDDALEAAITEMDARGIEAVAICLLFSYANPDHELRIARRVRDRLASVSISLSHVVDPAPREYDRTVSTLLDAWIAATGAGRLDRIRAAIPDRFRGRFLMGDGRGVLAPESAFAANRSILLTGGPAAATRAGALQSTDGIVLAVDVGSQSADISMSQGGNPNATEHVRLGGVDLRLPAVDMVSLGLGGARRVRRGPRGISFDATCDGAPSLDDAFAVLGHLPGPGDDSTVRLAAFAPDLTPEKAAEEIAESAANLMALELTRYATRRNLDPGRAKLVVMGGTGPLLATRIADHLGLGTVTIPRAPGVSGAIGLAGAPLRREASRRVDCALLALTDENLSEVIKSLEAEVPGAGPAILTLTLAALPQMHAMRLELAIPPASAASIGRDLTKLYQREYGVAPPGPGHLFSVTLHRDSAASLPPMPRFGTDHVDGPQMIETEAGIIHLPHGWRAEPGESGYRLTKTAP